MITTKLVVPEMSPEIEAEQAFVDKEVKEFMEKRGHDLPTPAETEKDDLDAPSTTAAGSEHRGRDCVLSDCTSGELTWLARHNG
jgi:hypothetical protein